MEYKSQSKAWILKVWWSRNPWPSLKPSQGSASKSIFIIITSFAFFSLILFQVLQSSCPVVLWHMMLQQTQKCIWEIKCLLLSHVVRDGCLGSSWTHLLPRIRKDFLLKETCKLAEHHIRQRRKKATLKRVREAENQSYYNTPPSILGRNP